VKLSIIAIFVFIANSSSVLATHHQTHIERIENGLRTEIRILGDKGWTIEERMKHYNIPGVSIAVIQDYRLLWVKSYGLADRETGQVVTPRTLFQAGSISKPVAAYGALKLVEQGKMGLEEAVNNKLTSWKIPQNQLTHENDVSLRDILSHSAGLTVYGFRDYPTGTAIPSLNQILEGQRPANSPPIRVNTKPATTNRYSGGGYTVLQQLMIDIEELDFPELMRKLVLKPINMHNSSFLQPLPQAKLRLAAAGYRHDASPVAGKRHLHPEMAAAGLWTSAGDLARFAADIQRALKNDSGNIISKTMAETMLTPVISRQNSLGFFIEQKGSETYFRHRGTTIGFSADLVANKNRGYGVVVMTNTNQPEFIAELERSIAAEYNWHEYLAPEYKALSISDVEFKQITGRYRYGI